MSDENCQRFRLSGVGAARNLKSMLVLPRQGMLDGIRSTFQLFKAYEGMRI